LKRRGVWLLALPAALMAPAPLAWAANVPMALATERQRIESADYRLEGRLVRVDASGARLSEGVSIETRAFPGVLRILVKVTSPAKARVHLLLVTHYDGRTSIEIAHPGDRAPTPLPFDKWSDGPLGRGFSYEDFLEQEFFWPNQTAEGEAKFGARACDVVESEPGPEDRTHYARVKTWLDQTIGFPIYEEKTEQGTHVIKEFTFFGLRHNEGVWSASQVEAKMRGQPGSTLLIIDRGSAKANLKLGDFSPAQTTRF
jgi:hypothetical protein